MQDNSDNQGTFDENGGLTETGAEKLFQAAFNQEDVSKITSTQPEKPQETVEVAKVEDAAPADKVETEGTKGSDLKDPNANPFGWVDALGDEDTKAKVAQILRERQELEHKYNSDHGRVSAAAKTVQSLRAELEKLKAAKEEKPQDVSLAAGKVDIPDDPEWSKIVEVDPELARAVDKRAAAIVEARMKQMAPNLSKEAEDRARAAVAPFEAQQVEHRWNSEMARLRAEVQNLDEVVSSPAYHEYLEYYATPEIRDMAAQADTYSKAMTVLQNYHAYGIRRWGVPEAAKPPVDTTVADKLAAQREAKLNKGVGADNVRQPVPSGGAGGKRTLETQADFEQFFLEQYNKK